MEQREVWREMEKKREGKEKRHSGGRCGEH